MERFCALSLYSIMSQAGLTAGEERFSLTAAPPLQSYVPPAVRASSSTRQMWTALQHYDPKECTLQLAGQN